jgi:hypothetical protein
MFGSGNSCGIIIFFEIDEKVQVLREHDPARVVAVVPRMAILAKKYEVVDVRGVEHLGQYSQPFPNPQLFIVSTVTFNL